MSQLTGNSEGIAVWSKLANSADNTVQEYFKRLSSASVKYGVVWFQDVERQYAGESGLDMYQLNWDGTQWQCSLFMKTQKSGSSRSPDTSVAQAEQDRKEEERKRAERILLSQQDDIVELNEDDVEEI